jgi:hypothetical protein
MIFLETMKVSHSIFFIGSIILVVLVLILPANFVENPANLVKIMLSDDSLDKISTLFIFVVIILFFGGGIIFTLEKGMERNAI